MQYDRDDRLRETISGLMAAEPWIDEAAWRSEPPQAVQRDNDNAVCFLTSSSHLWVSVSDGGGLWVTRWGPGAFSAWERGRLQSLVANIETVLSDSSLSILAGIVMIAHPRFLFRVAVSPGDHWAVSEQWNMAAQSQGQALVIVPGPKTRKIPRIFRLGPSEGIFDGRTAWFTTGGVLQVGAPIRQANVT